MAGRQTRGGITVARQRSARGNAATLQLIQRPRSPAGILSGGDYAGSWKLPNDPSAVLIESLLLAATRVLTFAQQQPLTNASGFFFERNGRLYLVTSRHVVVDEPSKHFPDRIEIELHIDADNMA